MDTVRGPFARNTTPPCKVAVAFSGWQPITMIDGYAECEKQQTKTDTESLLQCCSTRIDYYQ